MKKVYATIIMKFKKVTDDDNVFGFDIIEFIQFNYDGDGTALALCDGELTSFHKNDVGEIIDPDIYQLVKKK